MNLILGDQHTWSHSSEYSSLYKWVTTVHIPSPTKLMTSFLAADVLWNSSVLVKIWFSARVSIVIIRAPYTQTPGPYQQYETDHQNREHITLKTSVQQIFFPYFATHCVWGAATGALYSNKNWPQSQFQLCGPGRSLIGDLGCPVGPRSFRKCQNDSDPKIAATATRVEVV